MANLKASINFGLVHIPVEIATATDSSESVSFNQLDSKDLSRIRYKRINETTGKEVAWEDIVKGYEVSDGKYVTFTDEELKALATEANQSIEIDMFVDRADVPLTLFETPYYVIPGKGGEKGFAVLRQVLEKAKKCAVVQAVMRNKEHLAILYPEENVLVMEVLRYANEVKPSEEIALGTNANVKISEREFDMAERLVKEMTGKFKGKSYHDHYAERVHEAIDNKARGAKKIPTAIKTTASKKVLDMTDLLKRSLEEKRSRQKKTRKAV